ncbi:exported hypothetical protein [Gammaproteobacteria bacterium]
MKTSICSVVAVCVLGLAGEASADPEATNTSLQDAKRSMVESVRAQAKADNESLGGRSFVSGVGVAGTSGSLKLVKTVPMDSYVSTFGISSLAFGANYFWGLDGTALDPTHYIDWISPATMDVTKYCQAPNQSWADGSISVGYGSSYLWVLNFLDNVVYKVKMGSTCVGSRTVMAYETSVVSGVEVEGSNLWYGVWDYSRTNGGIRLKKINTSGNLLKSLKITSTQTIDDISFASGKMWATIKDNSGSYYIYWIDQNAAKILGKYSRNACESGIAFKSPYLWTADWCSGVYRAYNLP